MNWKEQLRDLYPHDTDRTLDSIVDLLERYRQRIDQSPSSSTRLNQSDAIMITYGDSFFGDGVATLECLRRFAVERLGDSISAIHLLPCFPYTSDDGFSVQDYYQIHPDMGDWTDIEHLGSDYEIMFDAVVNHISKSSDWFQGFLGGDPKFKDFFIVSDPDLDYSSVTRPRALPLLHPFQRENETVHVWTTFSEDQVDLNFHSAEVFVAVLDVLLFYVSRGARYIRLDAIAFIWKELQTTCMHLPQAHRIIQIYRHLIEQIAPQVVLITETNVPHEENVSYFGNGQNEAHMVYNFTLPPLLMHSLHQQDVSILTKWANSLELPSSNVCFFNFTASHDGVGVRPLQGIVDDQAISDLAEIATAHGGFVSMRDNGDGTQSPYEINCNYFDFATDPQSGADLRVQRFLLTQSVMLTMPGVPGIYYHSLIGSQNDRPGAIESGIKRRINREKLDLNQLHKELDEVGTIRHEVFSRYTRMLSARAQHVAFDPYGVAKYHQDGAVFVITRMAGGERMMALHNFSDQSVKVDIPNDAVDIFSEEKISDGTCELDPFGFRWVQCAS